MIIGFNGKMGVGKSEALKILSEISDNVHLVKFAQPLYDIQEYAYNRISSVYKRPETFIKDRVLLQWLGTEWGRNSIKETLWGEIWQAQVDSILVQDPTAIVVCDDLRFDNEAERMKNCNGMIVQIVSHRNGERIQTINANHASEAGIKSDYVDFVVENNGTLDEYRLSLYSLFAELGVTRRAA